MMRLFLIVLASFAVLGGICSQIFGSVGRFRFIKGMWAGVMVFISILIVLVVVTAVLVYTGVVTPEGFSY